MGQRASCIHTISSIHQEKKVQTRYSTKSITIESVFFNNDILMNIISLVEARDAFCLSLASKGYKLRVDEAAKEIIRLLSSVRFDGGFEITSTLAELNFLHTPLQFDMLLGEIDRLGYVRGDKTTIFSTNDDNPSEDDPDAFSGTDQTAICRNRVMRSGKHYATFNIDGNALTDFFYVWPGIIRPISRTWAEQKWNDIAPSDEHLFANFLEDENDEWGDSNVHYCQYYPFEGECIWGDWKKPNRETDQWVEGQGVMTENGVVGMLLDLDEGTLTLYINGVRKGILKDGLSGEYCWMATLRAQCTTQYVQNNQQVHIERISLPE